MTHTTVQKEAAPGRGDVAQAGPAAAGASVKAGLRGMSYEAREALQFKRTPVQRNEGPATAHAEDGHDHGAEPAPAGAAEQRSPSTPACVSPTTSRAPS